MKSALLLLALVVIVSASFTEEELKGKFNDFMHKYNKVYAASEFNQRYANFKASIERAAAMQATSTNAEFGVTKFSDLSVEEFRSAYLMSSLPERSTAAKPAEIGVSEADPAAPASFDWRSQNPSPVTAVKDQGQCGSCWAFSATEAIESAWILKGHTTNTGINLSPQQIVDCDTIENVQGCNGGYTESAYQYIVQAGGQEQIKDYPYTAVNGKCAFNKADIDAKISGYNPISKNESALPTNLASIGPLSICLDAAHWQDYVKGVMTNLQCCPPAGKCQMDHCVQVVGYDTSASPPYWIVRNSWNTDWGVDGYIMLEYGKNTCGIANDVTWPTSQ